MKNKNIIFWDFDGVMADSTNFVFSYWRSAFNEAGYTFEMADYQKTFTEKFPFDYLYKNFGSVAEEIYKTYSIYEEKNYPESVPPFPEFLSYFQKLPKKYEHFLISANLESVMIPWLKKYGIFEAFSEILGRETSGHKDEKILKIIEKNNLNKENCIFIGDTISDMNHAQLAGIECIGATWGVHTQAQLKSASPDYICDDLEELFKLLGDESK